MKKNNNVTISIVIGAVVILAAGFYLISKGNSSQSVTAQGTQPLEGDAMHGDAGNTKLAELRDLIGTPMPAFSLMDRNGTAYSAESLKGKNTVLFFNEGLMCYPSCWNQMVSLSKDSRFEGPDTQVRAIVVDQASEWGPAITKMPDLAKAIVLFDSDKSFSKRMGMMNVSSSMHPGAYPGHSYLIVDKEGIVRFAFDDPRMAMNDDLIAAKLQELQ